LLNKGYEVSSLFVDYGQIANKYEEDSSINISRYFDIKLKVVRVNSNLNFEQGEIFGRNGFLLFTGLMFGGAFDLLAIGLHSGSPYYDCSLQFFHQISNIVDESSNGLKGIIAPFLTWSKNEIITYAINNELPLNLTYSCEYGAFPPCNNCLSCIDRRILSVSTKA
jgi:7-cyano-7-deazaguanine synthase